MNKTNTLPRATREPESAHEGLNRQIARTLLAKAKEQSARQLAIDRMIARKLQATIDRRMIQDNGKGAYICTPTHCGYTGKTYCQNCGYTIRTRANASLTGGISR